MPGLQLTISNLFQLSAFISPFLLGFFLIMSSIFNKDIKGFIYLAGVLISTIINILLLNIIKHESSSNRDPICDIINFNIFNPGGSFNNPSLSSSFIAFTFIYLILPMVYNNQTNYIVIIFILTLYIINIITKLYNKCTEFGGIALGTLVGLIFGSLWYSLLSVSGNERLLYFNEFISNNVVCERPTQQSFKCAVYKNGELIKNNIV
jgi:hypothetical protein